MIDTDPATSVGVVLVDGVSDAGVAILLEVLDAANRLAGRVDLDGPVFDVARLGPREGPVQTFLGLQVETRSWMRPAQQPPNVLVLPAPGLRAADEVEALVEDHPLVGVVREAWDAGAELAAACSATFFLAEAGVLEGRRATTS